MVKVVSSIQINAFGLFVDGHDSQADVQRSKELPSLNLTHNGKVCFKQVKKKKKNLFGKFKQSF